MSTIKRNCMIIFLTLILTLISMLFIYFILKWLMAYIERLINFITYKFVLRLKWKYLLAFCEANMLIGLVAILVIVRNYLGDKISFLLCLLVLYAWSLIISYVRKERENMFSLLNSIYTNINTNNYFINRIVLLLKKGSGIIILFLAYEFTIIIFTQLEWPISIQYIAFISLPIYLNIWIYFSTSFKLNKDEIVNLKRIIVYFFLSVYVLFDCYSKFYSIIVYNNSPKLDLENLFLYITSVTFIGLERVIKSIIDDYKNFRVKA